MGKTSIDDKLELVNSLRSESLDNKNMLRSREAILNRGRTHADNANCSAEDSFFQQLCISFAFRLVLACLCFAIFWYLSQYNKQLFGLKSEDLCTYVFSLEENVK